MYREDQARCECNFQDKIRAWLRADFVSPSVWEHTMCPSTPIAQGKPRVEGCKKTLVTTVCVILAFSGVLHRT
eukprot:3168744-Amphidinium_carterae.1